MKYRSFATTRIIATIDSLVDPVSVHAEVVATGIPGAGAIALAPSTQPGQVLDGTRLFVASSSNFGAPLAGQTEAPGAILSLDVSGGAGNPVAVPANFATGGGPATAVGGKVILYSAQSPAFTNSVKHRKNAAESAGRRARPHQRSVGRPRRQIRMEDGAADLQALMNFLGCI